MAMTALYWQDFSQAFPRAAIKPLAAILRGAGKRISLCVLLEGKAMAKSIASRLKALEKMVARLISPQKKKKKAKKKKSAARKAAPKRKASKTKKRARRSRREPIIVPPPIML